MQNPDPSERLPEKVEYRDSGIGTEGIMTELPAKLIDAIEFDSVTLDEQPASKRVTLWFRQSAKYVFRIRLIRKGSRCIVEMSGMDPGKVLRGITVCKDHFDQWFGITPHDIESFENLRRHNQ
jgi:hypothetical protein